MIRLTLAALAAALLAGCAHQWTPEERAQLAREWNDPCRPTMGIASSTWCRSSGLPAPAVMASRLGQAQGDQ